MTDLILVWDAATSPDPLPDDAIGTACMVYVGGTSAARVWTEPEIDRVAHMPKLPVWVPTPGVDNPRQAGHACIAALQARGITPVNSQGQRQWVLVDLETGREPAADWLKVFVRPIFQAGYSIPRYGSPDSSHLFDYTPGTVGYWVANFNGQARLYNHANVVGTQFQDLVRTPGGIVDQSVMLPTGLPHLWV